MLAPAGDLAALKAALAAGADAVYFGLQEGFNARARAGNFALADLAATVARIHRAGARAYLAVNTLVFEPELAVRRARRCARAAACGVDALIVQDPAVAVLARAICPALEVHASTQMTISSAEGAAFAREPRARRASSCRASSRSPRSAASPPAPTLELEVFIHGALCVAWSGQCLTSEAWGGRSANRGQCAQSCRMPYDLVLDGAVRELGDVAYLLSPKDLAGLRAVGELVDVGVHGLKIEGRQKGAAYVATATAMYRHWVDAVTSAGGAERRRRGGDPERSAADEPGLHARLRRRLPRRLGSSDAGRGPLPEASRRLPRPRVARRARRGDGRAAIADGRPWTGGRAAERSPRAPLGTPAAALHGLGGADDASDRSARGARSSRVPAWASCSTPATPRTSTSRAGRSSRSSRARDGWVPALRAAGARISRGSRPGQRVWVTSDPLVARDTERLLQADEPRGADRAGARRARGGRGAAAGRRARGVGARAEVASASRLAPAAGDGLTAALLRDKLGGVRRHAVSARGPRRRGARAAVCISRSPS